MKKASVVFFGLLFFIGSSLCLKSQTIVTIGSGIGTSANFPLTTYYGYSYTQQIYTQAQINTEGIIEKINFYFSTGYTENSSAWIIYMGQTTKTSFISTSDWVPSSSLTEVFNGTVTFPSSSGWMEITLTTPFEYNNIDNLVIAVDENTSSWASDNSYWYTFGSGTNTGIYYRNDYTNPSPSSPPTASGRTSNINQLKLSMTSLSSVQKPGSFSATTASNSQIDLLWTLNDNNDDVVVAYSDDNIFGNPIDGLSYTAGNLIAGGGTVLYTGNATSFNHQSLDAATTYYYKIWSVDASDVYSSALYANSTTFCGIFSLPYTQNFDDDDWPICWDDFFSGDLTESPWVLSGSNNAGESPNEMQAIYIDDIGLSRLISPPLNTTGMSLLNVRFTTFYDDYGTGVTLKIQSSADGITWTDESWVYNGGDGDIDPETIINSDIVNNLGDTTYIAWVIDGDHYQYDEWFIDNVIISEQKNMAFVSATTTQTNLLPTTPSKTDIEIAGVEIVTEGNLNPISVSSFTFNTMGTTNPSDIASAELWFSESDPDFENAYLIGNTLNSPNGDFTFNSGFGFPVQLNEGTNYFWLTYNTAPGATIGNFIDVECHQLIVAGNTETPLVTAPAGNREIKTPMAGIYTIDNTQPTENTNFNNFDDAIYNLNLLGVGGPVTFNVIAGQTHNKTVLIENQFAYTILEGGTASNTIVFQKSGSGSNPLINITGTSETDIAFFLYGVSYITFDGIDINDAGTNANNYLDYGYFLSGPTDKNCSHITVENSTIDLNKNNLNAIGIALFSNGPTTSANANSYNSFLNMTITDSYTGYYIEGDMNVPDIGNVINTENSGVSTVEDLGYPTAATTLYGINAMYQQDFTLANTSIQNLSNNTSHYGALLNGCSGTLSCYNNTLQNLNSNNSNNNMYGLYISGMNNSILNVHDNTINNVQGRGNIYGFGSAGSADVLNFYNNKIYNVAYTASISYAAIGLYINGSIYNYIYNNYIYDIKAPGSTNAHCGTRGICIDNGTSFIFHNTVLLDYTSTSASNKSAALYADANVDVDIRNNIFVNKVNASTGIWAAAHVRTYNELTSFSPNSNNNLYYAGTPSAKSLIFTDNFTPCQSLSDYKTLLNTKDQNAISMNPAFISSSSPYDLHIDESIVTEIESGGVAFNIPVNVENDFDLDIRFGKTGYVGTGTAPDIGADEFEGIYGDATLPVITYTPLTNSFEEPSKDLSGVEITDNTGVDVTTNKPRIYFKRTTDPNDITGWQYTETQQTTPPFTFTIDYSLFGGVSSGNVVQYFVVAQDVSISPNVAINSGSFAHPQASINLQANAFPIGGTINSFTILSNFCGTVTVGSGGDYATLTGNGGVFQALNEGIMSCNTTVQILDDLTEPGTHALNQWAESGAGNYILTIEPFDASEKLIQGNISNALIRLNGAQRLVIDGNYNGNGKYLRFRNQNTSNPVLTFTQSAQNNTIKNAIFEGTSTSSNNGIIHLTNIGLNSSNTINSCDLRDRTDVSAKPSIAFYSESSLNANNTIKNCRIFNFEFYAIYLNATNTLIQDNEIFHEIPSSAASSYAIYLVDAPSTVIDRNKIHSLNGASSTQIKGIYYHGVLGVSMDIIVKNNQITLSPNTNNTIDGIDYWGYASNNLEMYHNSIYIGGVATSGSSNSYGIRKREQAFNFIQVNNTIHNARSNSGSTAKHYAISFNNINIGNTMTLNYNNYYVSSSDGILAIWFATDRNTLPDLQAASGRDANSMNADPMYTSALDLTPDAASPLKGAGTPIAGITTDYNNTSRNQIKPSIGAFELLYNNLIVDAPSQVINTNEDYQDVIIEPLGELTLENGNTLNVGGNFIIQSNTTGTGSFLQEGTLNIGGNAIVQKYLPTGTTTGWNLSVPVSNETTDVFDGCFNNKIWAYNPLLVPTDWYSLNPGDPLEPMTGYVVKYNTHTTVEFTGDLHGAASYTHNSLERIISPNNYGWNFVGNPYPCPIDWSHAGIQRTDVDAAVYFRKTDGGQASWTTLGGVNGGTNIIPAMQAFWVRVTQQTPAANITGTLTIDGSARILGANNHLKSTSANVLRLKINDNNDEDEILVGFTDLATPQFDSDFDAAKMFSYNNNAPQIYTIDADNQSYAINALPLPINNTIVPLGLKTNTGGSLQIKATDVTSFDTHIDILLEDLDENIITDLRQQAIYSFNATAGTTNNRFLLHFNTLTTNDNDYTEEINTVDIYTSNNNIYITHITDDKALVIIYNVLGQIVVSEKLYPQPLNKINLKLTTGQYYVNVINNKNISSKKIFINSCE